MKKKYLTDQEDFWAGEFCLHYMKRNQGDKMLASNLAFFSEALKNITNVKDCIEFGANIGMNTRALKLLMPEIALSALEINETAAKELEKVLDKKNIFNQSLLDFKSKKKWDLVIIKGVLIHINPQKLDIAYSKLVDTTKKYLLVAEYYNPEPVEVNYRGHKSRLFKRDFAGEILEKHPEMKLVDYGFVYKRDLNFPMDDVTWFLLQKCD